ncbi:uncharacterized protein L203_103053 [Cryptococcus depauperatus CBS 7841]|uniref:Uncharacterized protein n=1 Tax=Cryptococcus depauperatus CBS 7841 TaxID=1295531 RepID=A0A1E3IPN1_9TREE|nr:hypothetical protein L203_01673 [Cryptococcus depauperatus CBS 7841]
MAQPSQAEIISALTSQSAIPRTTPTILFSSLSVPLLELTNVVSADGLEERCDSTSRFRTLSGIAWPWGSSLGYLTQSRQKRIARAYADRKRNKLVFFVGHHSQTLPIRLEVAVKKAFA